jgi:hypothetical protein
MNESDYKMEMHDAMKKLKQRSSKLPHLHLKSIQHGRWRPQRWPLAKRPKCSQFADSEPPERSSVV